MEELKYWRIKYRTIELKFWRILVLKNLSTEELKYWRIEILRIEVIENWSTEGSKITAISEKLDFFTINI